MTVRLLPPAPLMAPLPLVLVSCGAEAERSQENPAADLNVPDRANVLAVAWTGIVCSDPPMLSISVRPERYSHPMIISSGEFVVNMVDQALLRAADFCGVRSGRKVDKLAACDLRLRPAAGLTRAQALAASPLTLSCRVHAVQHLGSHDLILGRIVAVEAQESLFDSQDRLALEKAGLIAYEHGAYRQLGELAGFFGYSVARPQVLTRRMPQAVKASPQRPDAKARQPAGKTKRPRSRHGRSSGSDKPPHPERF